MPKDLAAPAPAPAPGQRQRAELLVEAGKHVRLRLGVDVTSGGLLSVAVLVSGILLSTAAIVTAAGKAAARRQPSVRSA